MRGVQQSIQPVIQPDHALAQALGLQAVPVRPVRQSVPAEGGPAPAPGEPASRVTGRPTVPHLQYDGHYGGRLSGHPGARRRPRPGRGGRRHRHRRRASRRGRRQQLVAITSATGHRRHFLDRHRRTPLSVFVHGRNTHSTTCRSADCHVTYIFCVRVVCVGVHVPKFYYCINYYYFSFYYRVR